MTLHHSSARGASALVTAGWPLCRRGWVSRYCTRRVVNVDTLVNAPGAPALLAPPDLTVISIHPPGPCRARASGYTVTFTPILMPSPPPRCHTLREMSR